MFLEDKETKPTSLTQLRYKIAVLLGCTRPPKKFMNETEFRKLENFLRILKDADLEEFFLSKFEESTFSYICPENEAFIWSELD